MTLDYSTYLDKILGGWIGKSIGGTLGARFEGVKSWIELELDDVIPDEIPPNDDLDLQVVWLKVLEEKGPSLTSEDLADAWLEGCWYPFNEYGNFRRNYRNGIVPPYTGSHDNAFFESGMGCPIRSEIWGYVFPGLPHLAAKYARLDGVLDHTDESVCPEEWFSAVAADAFFESDIRVLLEKHFHYMKPGLWSTRLSEAAFRAYDEGLSLADARQRLLLLGGHPEPCDAMINVPFTVLALLYGEYDLEKTVLAALRLGYDTDCTLATAGAFIGQILGARAIPEYLRDIVGDELVMGIEYTRDEMTLSALARDTAMVGCRMTATLATDLTWTHAPEVEPFPGQAPVPTIVVDYPDGPAAAPGDTVRIELEVSGALGSSGAEGATITVEPPEGWSVAPPARPFALYGSSPSRVTVLATADTSVSSWAQGHHFSAIARLDGSASEQKQFGFAGAMLWRLLSVDFEPNEPLSRTELGDHDRFKLLKMTKSDARDYVIDFAREYVDEGSLARDRNPADVVWSRMSTLLGEQAVVRCRDSFIDPKQLIGLRGTWVCYLDAELISPRDRDVQFMIGSNDGYRLWVNGEVAGEEDVQRWWTAPRGTAHHARLTEGANRLFLKLAKREEDIRFSLGIREQLGTKEFPRKNDWVTDLSWGNP